MKHMGGLPGDLTWCSSRQPATTGPLNMNGCVPEKKHEPIVSYCVVVLLLCTLKIF